MSGQPDLDALLARHLEGGGWAPLARAISLIENSPPWSVTLPAPTRPAHVIGITGPPGAGKSTLIGRLIRSFTGTGVRVAVLAIDPSSPVSGGAVLGDRLRMEASLTGRDDVFVRSLASRGSHGAIAGATRNVARLLEVSGSFDVILIETVGAGQTEVAIAELADTIVLVTVPGLGDAVQAIKAGVMEVADLIVVNMADRPGARETVRHLRLSLDRELAVLETIATQGTGVDQLCAELQRRWTNLQEGEGLDALRARKRQTEAALVALAWTRECAAQLPPSSNGNLTASVRTILEEAATRWNR